MRISLVLCPEGGRRSNFSIEGDGRILEMLVCFLLFAVGIVLVIKGGDAFVDAAGWIARAMDIPVFIIGATIVSLATTMPEMIVSGLWLYAPLDLFWQF